jgi:hypothetical protein
VKPFNRIRGLHRKHRRVASGSAVAVLSTALVAGAVLHPGFATADVDLNDGGVWVTNSGLGMVGHLNYPSRMLDGGFAANSDGFDIVQQAATVINVNTDQAKASPVDVAAMVRGTEVQLPGAADIALGGDTVAITDRAGGAVWISTAAALGSFSDQDLEPAISDAPGTVAAVSTAGTVMVASPADGLVHRFAVNPDGSHAEPQSTEVDALRSAGDLQIAAVGDDPVVLDSASGTLVLPGGRTVALNVEDARLQQSGPESSFVAVATPAQLIQQPLDGSDATITDLGRRGIPAAPVQQDSCVHAAWAASGVYLRDCADDGDDARQDIPGLGGESRLVFRVNRDVVVLNDINAGDVWLVTQNMQLVDNWGDVMPPEQKSDDEDEDAASENPVQALPDRTGENRPPVAADDTFGARAGRTTILGVLENDTDPDGDLLIAQLTSDQPAGATVQRIYHGAGLQIVIKADSPRGRRTFTYEVRDGRGGSDTARVTVDVRGPESNRPPEPKRPTTIMVEQGKSVSRNVLDSWTDPDGDDLLLVGAKPTEDGDQVRTRSDGLLTFRDVGKSQGRKKVEITVSDGSETASGVVTFDVRAAGTLPPLANFDHFTATVGQEVQLSPLHNDADPSGGRLTLARAELEASADASLTPDYETGTIAFTPARPGSFYIEYLVTNGPQSASGLIRVDAQTENAEGAPVAVRDVALLPRNGDVLVDVLANDADPAGGVLVVQSVDVPDASPIDVAVLDHNILRIHDVRGLEDRTTLRYTVSNGQASATGEVNVLSVDGPETLLPPQASPDTATVRAGDVVNIPVIANDTHPNGDELTLNPVLAQSVPETDGRLFASENSLRFVAGPKAKTVYAIYEVMDSTGQKDSAEVRINIRPREGARNTPPVPKNLEARVIAGSTVRIPVPLDGIDADGDSAFLTGIDTAPSFGAAVAGPNYIDFTASAKGAGTDTFTYTVRDRLGLENTGTVRVGIAPPAEANQKPIAVNDGAILRPGRAIAVDALRNDSDPDGDPIALDPSALESNGDGMRPEVSDGRVLFTAPAKNGTFNVRYGVRDDRGGTANGNITVTVDQNAPLLRPIARDDRVDAAETKGRTAVDVPVLENDEDPDGVAEDLTVRVEQNSATASVTAENVVRVELAEQSQLVPYTVEDIDGGLATAVIWVPGLGEQYPTLRSDAPLEVRAGEELMLDLRELVDVRDGRTPRVTVVEKVSAIGTSNAGSWVEGPHTLRYAAAGDYAGTGSITFEVTDGKGPDDPEGVAATLTILTEVIPAPERNLPPELSSGSLDVAKGEPAAPLDLAGLASDPNPEDTLRFSLEGQVPAGLRVSLDGTRLQAAAEDSAAVGSTGEVGVSVTDGKETVSGKVVLTVLASSRPLPVAHEDVVPKAIQGKPITVPVLDNDVNPFPESPLEILGVEADGNGTASVQGRAVVVTPAADFVGSMTVRYTVQDKLAEPNRQATGRILLTVEGKPGTPSTPVVESARNKAVVLSWDPPASNGSPVTSYAVTGSHGFRQQCPATTCTLTGLTNNVEYVFRVAATNANGTSEPSAESAVARPDTQPAQPAPPTLTFGDRELTVGWKPPANDGSPIESYDLQISPAPPNGVVQKSVTGGPVVWAGLENGTAYRVRVQARNAAPEPSEWSDYSMAETPAGVPGTPQAPTTTRAESVGTQSQMVVDWNDVDPNGDAVSRYQVREFRGGALIRTLPHVPASQQTITVPNSEEDYSYAVRAYNKAGWSPYGPQSSPRRAVGTPGSPTGVSLTESRTGAEGRAVVITFNPLTAAQRNGARSSEVSYRASFSDGRQLGVSPGQEVRGFTNGSTVTATVTAHVSSDGATYSSAPSARSNAARPYGSPGTPSATARGGAEGDPSVTFSWFPPSYSNHDVAQIQINIDGGGWQNVADSGTRRVSGSYSELHTIKVRSLNSRGTAGNVASASARGGSKPPPAPVEWNITAGGPELATGSRTCMDPASGTNWTGSGCLGDHWLYDGQTIKSNCYIVKNDIPWYRQKSGPNPSNNGLHAKGIHTTQGRTPPAGMPRC